ncbi:MAG: nucleotide sugar dehydrogenase [Planctomycetota bacterium]|nr:nucleotide sugar dehydrogenase [Planctomycetota bacterium]
MERADLEAADELTVGIVGLGAVGIPLASMLARAPGIGLRLHDLDEGILAALKGGRSPLAHLDDALVAPLAGQRGSTDPAVLADCDAVLVCVPTPLTEAREPDLGAVRAAAVAIAENASEGALVVLESTTWPGTTREVLGGALAGRPDLELAYSPERVDPGRLDPEAPGGDPLGARVPKLVGGTSPGATERATALYERVFETVVPVSSAEVAEAAKLVENVHRAVNIALVGELKIAFDAMGLDIWEVLDAAATKPFGFTRFDPGPGMGGHCLPIDPFYLAWAARRAGAETRFVELSGEINRAMPGYVASKVEAALGRRGIAVAGARVLLIGVAYKRGVGITEESPAFPLAARLRGEGAEVSYCDPLVPLCELGESRDLAAALEDGIDVCVVLVDQDGVELESVAAADVMVVDTRAALRTRLLGDPRYVPA